MDKLTYRQLRREVRLAWSRFYTERADGRAFTWQDEERNRAQAVELERLLPGGLTRRSRIITLPLLDQFPHWATRRQALRIRQEERAKVRQRFDDLLPWQRAALPAWELQRFQEAMA